MAAVVITGFMGTGKTRVGGIVAREMKRPFLDTDAMIEQAEGKPVSEIFRAHGEAYFRECERAAVRNAARECTAVIATGGGTMMDEENAARLRAAGPVVCLWARPELLLERVRAERSVRPLLDVPDPMTRLRELLEERRDAYAQVADVMLDTSDRSPEEVATEVVQFLARRGAGDPNAPGATCGG